jgi:hypothetical protein
MLSNNPWKRKENIMRKTIMNHQCMRFLLKCFLFIFYVT